MFDIDDLNTNVNLTQYSSREQKLIFAKLLISLYENYNIVGGNLHIYLEDDNFEDQHIGSCLRTAISENDYHAVQICHLLLEFSTKERRLIKRNIPNEGYEWGIESFIKQIRDWNNNG